MLYENVFSLKLTFTKHFIRVIIFYACGSKVKKLIAEIAIIAISASRVWFWFHQNFRCSINYWLPCYF